MPFKSELFYNGLPPPKNINYFSWSIWFWKIGQYTTVNYSGFENWANLPLWNTAFLKHGARKPLFLLVFIMGNLHMSGKVLYFTMKKWRRSGGNYVFLKSRSLIHCKTHCFLKSRFATLQPFAFFVITFNFYDVFLKPLLTKYCMWRRK